MFTLKGRGPADPKDAGKPTLKPALYDPPGSVGRMPAGGAPRPPAASHGGGTQREGLPPAPAFPLRDDAAHSTPAAPASASAAASAHAPSHPPSTEIAGSKLSVGVNIKLKGVEISDCDVLVIEGHVEATVQSKVMQIAKPGTLKGTAMIDVAEVNGEFSGELTARSRLVVNGTGRVTGTIRYGQLIVAEGGEVSGDVKPIEAAEKHPPQSRAPATDTRYVTPHARGTNTNSG
ncbi:MAG TPA: polymer-forming cytoskeletal protein [Casimicrobiaceae bacterium]|nr:polymer-forming cytoskeletal protein [Casimicrobiaceae bacterium]